MALSKEQLEAFERQYKRVIHITSPADIVVRPPSRAECRAYKEELSRPASHAMAQENLIAGCVVYPPHDEFQALLEDYGMLCDGIASTPGMKEFLGLEVQAAAKKSRA